MSTSDEQMAREALRDVSVLELANLRDRAERAGVPGAVTFLRTLIDERIATATTAPLDDSGSERTTDANPAESAPYSTVVIGHGSGEPIEAPRQTVLLSSDAELVATIEACERRRLEMLAEIAAVHRQRVAAIAELRARHSVVEVAALLGVTRQQVYRLTKG